MPVTIESSHERPHCPQVAISACLGTMRVRRVFTSQIFTVFAFTATPARRGLALQWF